MNYLVTPVVDSNWKILPRHHLSSWFERMMIFMAISTAVHTLCAPLEWMPDQFLSLDGQYIQCGLHGAHFEIDSGLCIDGPCITQSLTPIVIKFSDGKVLWEIKPGG